MIVAMERKLILELIDEYKTCTCLWRIKDPDYKNKEMKNEAYESLLQLIKKYNNNFNDYNSIRTLRGERNNNINIIGITQKDAAAYCGARDRSSATSVVECRPRRSESVGRGDLAFRWQRRWWTTFEMIIIRALRLRVST